MQKGDDRIHKRDWKPRSELEFELGSKNVIYTLLDTSARQVYVGQAADLVKRLAQPHPSIPHWDFFRYDALPSALAPYRLALERMFIRALAAMLKSKSQVLCMDTSGCTLSNDRIDE